MNFYWNHFKKIFGFFWFKIKYPKVTFVRPRENFTYFSQYGQDWYLSSLLFPFLTDQTNNLVLDIGCNHPEKFSNTLFFEKFFNCATIAVDPLCEYNQEWSKLRPSAVLENIALGKQNGKLELIIPSLSDLNERDVKNSKTPVDSKMFSFVKEENILLSQSKIHKIPATSRVVDCITVKELLNKHNAANVLICSVDVEGFEINILEGIDFDNHRISCFCIENNSSSMFFGNDVIRKFLRSKGYIFYARIGFSDDVFIHPSLLKKL